MAQHGSKAKYPLGNNVNYVYVPISVVKMVVLALIPSVKMKLPVASIWRVLFYIRIEMYKIHVIASSSILLQGNLLDSMTQIEHYMDLHTRIELLLSTPAYRVPFSDSIRIAKNQVDKEVWRTLQEISFFIFNDLVCDDSDAPFPRIIWEEGIRSISYIWH